jgi:hypothetical protein
MLQASDKVVPLDIGFLPEASVSGPVLLQTDDSTFLTFNTEAGTGIVEFMRCSITKFGYPNDEALGGHPLYKRGLKFYGVFEVLHSSWIAEMTAQNRVCFPNTQDSTLRHFAITFHDSTFECVADSFVASFSTEPYDQIFQTLSQRALRP